MAVTVPLMWSKTSADLIAAIADATRLFAERGKPRRYFKWEPQPQPNPGNHARVAIAHRDTGTPGDLSLTSVTVGFDGIVLVRHRSFDRKYELSNLGRKDWDLLLADIYKSDEQARDLRFS